MVHHYWAAGNGLPLNERSAIHVRPFLIEWSPKKSFMIDSSFVAVAAAAAVFVLAIVAVTAAVTSISATITSMHYYCWLGAA